MHAMEKVKKKRQEASVDVLTPQDIREELHGRPELMKLMQQLPVPLWQKHFEKIAAIGDGNDAARQQQVEYLSGVLETRRDKTESLTIGDTPMRSYLEQRHAKHALGSELEVLLSDTEEHLGKGQTARVRSLKISGSGSVAVKYLLTPTPQTQPVEAEYGMLREVETVSRIETEQVKHEAGSRISVPHPHFYFKNEKIQCYAMQEIEGVTLQELLDPTPLTKTLLHDRRNAALKAFSERYADPDERLQLEKEAVRFMEAVHEVCLHGDIKLGNIMVDDRGNLYLIDFGQSKAMSEATEDTRDQFDNLQENEIDQFRECIKAVYHELRKQDTDGRSKAA